ncbi:uncharacterized protein TrAtP1_013317 [Trichoderma atroviride]|uniref:uncharacterized protein n=1 Tax=Hypocrea atroviridis TaxID=63577 RepID=UPI0033229D91|nr:hypothetical protein TrAtP1_013317 [Trichoderma atroviride]
MAFQNRPMAVLPPFLLSFLFFSVLYCQSSLSSLLPYLPVDFVFPPGTSRPACFSTTASKPRGGGGPRSSHLGFRGSLASLRTDQRLTGLPRPWFKLNPPNTQRLDVLHTDDSDGGYLSRRNDIHACPFNCSRR